MKKYLFLAAALTVMGCGMSSCSNEADVVEQTEQAPKVTKLVFTVAEDAETRATWGGTNGRTPMFENGEKVSLFSENNNNVELTATVSGSTVTLTGEGVADTELYFVHPYCATATMADGKITSTDGDSPYNYFLGGYGPMSREISENKYPSRALSLAKSTDGGATALSFKGLMAILKYTPASDITGSLYVFGGAGQTPCGQMTINVSSSSIEYAENDSKIWCPNAAKNYSFTAGNSYYIALPAFSSTDETVIGITDPEVVDHILCTKVPGITFEAGKMYSIGAPAADPHLLPGSFSVSATKKVKFTKSNLYWSNTDSKFHFEAKPTDYPTTRNQDHIGHFYWTKTAEASYAASYNDGTNASSDIFFADGSDASHTLTVDGMSGLYILSLAEWEYLVNRDGSETNRKGKNNHAITVTEDDGTTVIASNCIIIAPDNATFDTSKASYTLTELDEMGLVCLPAAGSYSTSVSNPGSDVRYWTSSPNDDVKAYRIQNTTSNDKISTYSFNRARGYSLRAVKNE